jgi:hypothetical protein
MVRLSRLNLLLVVGVKYLIRLLLLSWWRTFIHLIYRLVRSLNDQAALRGSLGINRARSSPELSCCVMVQLLHYCGLVMMLVRQLVYCLVHVCLGLRRIVVLGLVNVLLVHRGFQFAPRLCAICILIEGCLETSN